MKWIYSIIHRLFIYLGIKKAPVIPLSKEAKKLRLELTKVYASCEENSSETIVSEETKREVVEQLIRTIPKELENALKSKREDFNLCYPNISHMSVPSLLRSSVFQECVPLLKKRLKELNIPFSLGSTVFYFDVAKLRKSINFDKTKNLM